MGGEREMREDLGKEIGWGGGGGGWGERVKFSHKLLD